jgi:hypothetical protein
MRKFSRLIKDGEQPICSHPGCENVATHSQARFKLVDGVRKYDPTVYGCDRHPLEGLIQYDGMWVFPSVAAQLKEIAAKRLAECQADAKSC